MIVEYIRYSIDDGRAEAFEDAYRRASEALETSEHCERYEVSRCSEDPTQHVVRIEWDSEEGHLSGFRQSPEFRGSFSLKRVLPAVVPALAYEGLEVAEGSAAGPVWDLLVRGHPDPAEAARLEAALREYCRRDTLGMVELVRTLGGPTV